MRPPAARTATGPYHRLFAQRLAEIEAKANAGALEDVEFANQKLRISPLRAIMPDEAETALASLYARLPRWTTELSGCFTHLTTGRAHEYPRAIFTAVLADATNLGHARMAGARGLVTQRQLSWPSAWHLREDSYGAALARLAESQHKLPLAMQFGTGTASSSNGQHFPLDRRARATGRIERTLFTLDWIENPEERRGAAPPAS